MDGGLLASTFTLMMSLQTKRLLKGSKKTTRLLESFDGLRLWILLRDGRAGLFFSRVHAKL